ncbi:NAD(P)/FAD-dependent oxidoreductase [Methylobacterium sp. ID0610]|uniref:NAD(P)/FAD-dependent oxidoreductase n=1 Tax=Methylobacterium carpenticola TaxID=3344827 RepID=UPI0036AA1652
MAGTVLVLGAGIVGLSIALHLQRRGQQVLVVDRRGPGAGASFGNGGLIQREAVFPYPFPREAGTLLRIARNRSIDAAYHPLALPPFASPLLRYWWHSAPARYDRAVAGYSRLILTCLDEHRDLAAETGAGDLLRPLGWMRLYDERRDLDAAAAEAEAARRDYGVGSRILDGDALAAAEPALLRRKAGALHWTDALSLSDPQDLVLAYARRVVAAGGAILTGDAGSLERHGAAWRLRGEAGPVEAERAVVALGAASLQVTRRFGYAPPLFPKRGYHMHYTLRDGAVLNRPVLDGDNGYLLAPMRRGVRLTTGAEFARQDAAATPTQLARAEPVARGLLPLAERVDAEPWMGTRPCMPDMLPVIGRVGGAEDLWCAFGHGHQGMTLGPSTGRLVAEMITGEPPFVDPAPYRPDRY